MPKSVIITLTSNLGRLQNEIQVTPSKIKISDKKNKIEKQCHFK